MQLTLFSDYSLRIALYLAMHPERLVRLEEIARAYGISQHHLVKVVQFLVENQVVRSVRGRGGGLALAQTPEQINIGTVVRRAEPHMNLVECFDDATNSCPISPVCGLKGTLLRAQRAFFEVLDQQTLADFVPRASALIPLWRLQAGPAAANTRALPREESVASEARPLVKNAEPKATSRRILRPTKPRA